MLRLLLLALLQSALLAAGQVTLKISLQQMGAFAWRSEFFARAFGNPWFAVCGLCFGVSSLLWMYIVKHFPLSMAYPLISLSYVMGMLAAVSVFHEQIPAVRWVGLALIMMGVILVVQR